MLSLFPWILTYEEFSPLLLRLTLGIIFLFWAYRRTRRENKESRNMKIACVAFEAILGVCLIIGFLTQLIALLTTLVFLTHLVRKVKDKAFLTNGINYYFILLIISLCLLLSGPGAFSIDLPL
jgi:hypothetical protein